MDIELIKNQFYWIEDSDDTYMPCRLIGDNPNASNQYEFETYEHGDSIWVNVSSIKGIIPSPGEITLKSLYDDLTEAVDISEASILWNLHKRYEVQKIYSAIGPILIAINPYCFLEEVYSEDLLAFFLNASTMASSRMPPHIWGIARDAYIQLREKNVRQAIVISGESGAGKTETTKKCLQFLSAASMNSDHVAESDSDSHHTAIEDRVLRSNPLLESFGNSKTCRNNNSSRFGKWLEINFNCGSGKFCLIGANITQYLLEKSRVVTQADDERNYHIFYQMCAHEDMALGAPENYAYLNQSGCTSIEGVDDYDDFLETRKAFHALHFTDDDQSMIFNALKAILYLGNVTFEDSADTAGQGGSAVSADTNHCLQAAALLLGFSAEDLSTAITVRTISVPGEVMVVPLVPDQAVDTRNAFAKEIYGRLFSQIVAHANKSLAFAETNGLHAENESRQKHGKRRLSMQGGQIVSIGLLDIFGFEIFTANSFEQLCINYGNEKLQQYFINYVLKKEQETYSAEGIVVEEVHPVDNQDVLALLESSRTGVLSLLDEELRLPQGSDQGFLRKVEKEHKGKSSRFKRDFRMKDDHFEISHFAGTVLYSAGNFLDKNKDKLYDHLEELVNRSTVPRFQEIMNLHGPGTEAASKKVGVGSAKNKQLDTLASRFTGQLQQLVDVLQSSEPHFVRCIKPNNLKSPVTFDSDLVLRQLRYSGVLEAIQIRKSGYPTRKTHADFLKNYRMLAGVLLSELSAMSSDRERCVLTLKNLASKRVVYADMKLGKSMIFYRPDVHNALEQDRIEVGMRAILYLQSAYRRRNAAARVQVLWEACRSLLAAMSWGQQNNSSGVEAADEIENCLIYCEQVHLQCHILKDGRVLLDRLHAVQKCLDNMDVLITSELQLHHETDVVSRYYALSEAIAEAGRLEIVHDTYNTLVEKAAELKTRADAVVRLRCAVTSFDELLLGNCLHEIAALGEQWGPFCEDERISAYDLYTRLCAEVTMADSICDIIRMSQDEISNIRNKYKGTVELTSDADIVHAISSSLGQLQTAIAPVQEYNGHAHPLCTTPSRNMLGVAELFIEARSCVLKGEWQRIADLTMSLLELANSACDWIADGVVKSESLRTSCESMKDFVDKEIASVADGIDVHVVLPLLRQGLAEGSVAVEGDVCDVAVDPSWLQEAVDQVHRIQSVGKSVTGLLSLAENLLQLRRSVQDDCYEKVLALTESGPVTSCRVMRCKALKLKTESVAKKAHIVKQASTGFQVNDLKTVGNLTSVVEAEEDYEDPVEQEPRPPHGEKHSFLHFPSLSDFSELENESRLFHSIIMDRCQDFSRPFVDIVEGTIMKEIEVAREYALDRYIQDPELTVILGDAVAEVSSLWSAEINDEGLVVEQTLDKRLSSLSKRLYLVASIVCETRALMKLESYEEVLEMHSSGKLTFSICGRNGEDEWTPEVLSDVLDELLVCVAESRNFNAKKVLVAAMKVGTVSGTIGQIITKDISYDRLTAAIRLSESCLEEDPRPTSTLKAMVVVAKQLVDVRRAFQILGPEEQLRTFRKLQSYEELFPEEMQAEVRLLSCETDYRETTDLLERGLKHQPPVRYLVRASSVVVNRRKTLLTVSPVRVNDSTGDYEDEGDADEYDEDEWVPNMAVLSVDVLNQGLDVALRLQKTHHTFTLSEYMLCFIELATLIRDLRVAVVDKKWSSADEIICDITQPKFAEVVSTVAAEIAEAKEVVGNELMLHMCENALCSDQAQVCPADVSLLDLSHTSIVGLEEAIHKCQMSSGHRRLRAEVLYSALLGIRDLRRAVMNGDWSGARKTLGVLRQGGIGQSNAGVRGKFTAMCEREIDVIGRAVVNQDCIRAVKVALLEEVIRGKPGDIDVEKIEIYKLTEANGTVVAVAGSIRGEFLVLLHNLSEIVLKGRKASSQQQWNIMRNLAPMWSEKLKQLKLKSTEFVEVLPSLQPVQPLSADSSDKSDISSGPTFDVSKGGGLSVAASAQYAYKEFEYLLNSLIDELDLLQNHVTMIQLEGEVSKALLEHGVSSNEMVGQIDLSAIRTDGLEVVLERKNALLKATNSTLPPHVEKLCKAAHLMLDIRRAILQNMWDGVPALLEEALTGTYHPLPEACRQEVQVIRLECENRWIINSITTALDSGKLEGTFDTFKDTSDVNCDHLRLAITACQTLTPRTDEAATLLKTAEEILKLRTMIVEEHVEWQRIGEYASGLLEGGVLHERGLAEVHSVMSIAQNTIVCRFLEQELVKGRTRGQPGHLLLSEVSTEGLAAACQYCMDSSVKSIKANELLNACRSVMTLRDALLRAAEFPDEASEALSCVKSIVQSMYEAHSKNPKDAGWQLCKNEVALVTQDAHIREVNRQLESSVAAAGRIYASRNAASIGAAPGSRRASVNASAEAVLSCESLDDIIAYVDKLDFSSQVLDDLSDCARSLRLVRDAVINSDWDYVHLLGTRDDVVGPIMTVPYAIPELSCAKQEAHNRVMADKLESVLSSPHTRVKEDDPYHEYLSHAIDEAEASDITAMATQQLLECAKNVYLLRVGLSTQDNKQVAQALRWFGVNAYRCPSSVQEEAQKAYIAHQNALLLTGITAALQAGYATGVLGDMNISSVDTATLSKLLTQAHDVKHQTPDVREMVEVAEMIHALRCAQRAKDGEGISKALDMLASWGKMLPPIVVEEVAFARSERDNTLAVTALQSIFATFDASSSASLEMSLMSSATEGDAMWLPITTEGSSVHSGKGAKIRRGTAASAVAGRRYSIASMNRADIDLDTIDVVALDKALDEAHEHGLYTEMAKTLYKTVYTLRSLRDAMKHNDWPRVEELLAEVDTARLEDAFAIDSLADNELSVIRNQLEMRTSIVDLSKALKTGWARCSNGIVDTDPLRVDSLVDAITRAQRSMHDLGIASDMKKLTLQRAEVGKKSDLVAALASSRDDRHTGGGLMAPLIPVSSPGLKRFRKHFPKEMETTNRAETTVGSRSPVPADPPPTAPKSKVQEQVEKLILSAVIVAEVRKALHDGRVQMAGELSEQALEQGVHSTVQDELNHYAFEIGRAMHMMRLCNQLRDGITNGSGDCLEKTIQDAKDASIAVSGDLGLVRTLERATTVLRAINKVRKLLNGMASIYEPARIEEVLVQAKKLNISGYLIENATARLSVLQQFQTGLQDLNIGDGGMVTGRSALQMICDLSVSLGLKNHPVARKAHVLLRLNENSLCRALLADAMASGNVYAAATETIKVKRQYLRLPECLDEYSIEKFPRLRPPAEFSMRLALESSELKHSMLRHTDGLIGTSLTKLSPELAALAVVVFTHTTKVLEENTSSAPEVLLRNLINLGRSCPIMRDEIQMQFVKQIRENPSEESEVRVWRSLRACLKFFPPSSSFENYLESFLLTQVKQKPDLKTILVCSCIRYMHEAIALYGYNRKIRDPWDSSLKSVKLWLQSSNSLPSDSSPAAVSGASPGKPFKTSSSQRGPLLYTQLDPAFVTDIQSQVPPSLERGTADLTPPMTLNSPENIRGTRENWMKRFRLLSQDEDDVSLGEFNEMMFSSSKRIDELDRMALRFWVCGLLPSRSSAVSIVRELIGDHKLFFAADAREVEKSKRRRKILSQRVGPPRTVNTDSIDDMLEAVTVFWNSVVCPCASSDIVSELSVQSISTRASSVKEVVRPAHSSSPSGAIMSRSLSDVAASLAAAPVSSPSSNVLPEVAPEEAFITWEMYRDIVQVGSTIMITRHEKYLRSTTVASRERVQRTSPSKKLSFAYNTPMTKSSKTPVRSRRTESSAIVSNVRIK